MSDKIKVITLNPTGTWEEETGHLQDKHVRTKRSQRLISVSRDTVFPRYRPQNLESLMDIGPETLTRPTFSNGARCIVVGQNDPSPIRFSMDKQTENETLRREAKVLKQVMRHEASEQEATRSNREEMWTKVAFIASVTVAVLAVFIGIAVLLPKLTGGG